MLYHFVSMDSNCKYYCYKNNKKLKDRDINKPDKVKLVFFDMDGVLADTISSWKKIHDYFGTSNDKSIDDYLKGKINDLEFIERDVSLWKKTGNVTTKYTIEDILFDTPVMNGAKEFINYLKKNDIKTAIISAGLDILANKLAEELGIDYVYANGVKEDAEGILTGEGILKVELTGKDKNVKKLAKKLNIEPKDCAAIGNSCFDIPMFNNSGLAIAFNPEDQCVRKSADIIVEGKNLKNIIPKIKPYI